MQHQILMYLKLHYIQFYHHFILQHVMIHHLKQLKNYKHYLLNNNIIIIIINNNNNNNKNRIYQIIIINIVNFVVVNFPKDEHVQHLHVFIYHQIQLMDQLQVVLHVWLYQVHQQQQRQLWEQQ